MESQSHPASGKAGVQKRRMPGELTASCNMQRCCIATATAGIRSTFGAGSSERQTQRHRCGAWRGRKQRESSTSSGTKGRWVQASGGWEPESKSSGGRRSVDQRHHGSRCCFSLQVGIFGRELTSSPQPWIGNRGESAKLPSQVCCESYLDLEILVRKPEASGAIGVTTAVAMACRRRRRGTGVVTNGQGQQEP